MKNVKLRRLLRESRLLESVGGDEEIIVTQFGKPCVRVLPRQPKSFLGAGGHLGVKMPVTAEPIPLSEWNGLF